MWVIVRVGPRPGLQGRRPGAHNIEGLLIHVMRACDNFNCLKRASDKTQILIKPKMNKNHQTIKPKY